MEVKEFFVVYDLRLEGKFGKEVTRFNSKEQAEEFVSVQDEPESFEINKAMAMNLF